MLVPFDWPSWQDEAEAYYREPERLRTADFTTIRNLFTLHVLKELVEKVEF